MHEAEAPFVVGRAPRRARYSAVPSESAAYAIFQRLAEQLMSTLEADAGRTFLLSGPRCRTCTSPSRAGRARTHARGPGAGGSGDVSEAAAGGRRPAWALPRGVLSFVHVPGHAPGQVLPRMLLGCNRFCCMMSTSGAPAPPPRW